MQAAAELFSARGYDGASTRDIAEKAGVNVALINRYFGSKAKLFNAAIVPMLSIHGMSEGDISGFMMDSDQY